MRDGEKRVALEMSSLGPSLSLNSAQIGTEHPDSGSCSRWLKLANLASSRVGWCMSQCTGSWPWEQLKAVQAPHGAQVGAQGVDPKSSMRLFKLAPLALGQVAGALQCG